MQVLVLEDMPFYSESFQHHSKARDVQMVVAENAWAAMEWCYDHPRHEFEDEAIGIVIDAWVPVGSTDKGVLQDWKEHTGRHDDHSTWSFFVDSTYVVDPDVVLINTDTLNLSAWIERCLLEIGIPRDRIIQTSGNKNDPVAMAAFFDRLKQKELELSS